MAGLTEILTNYGYFGMFLSAFLSGSIVPFSSEAVMVALMAAGLKTGPLLLWATIGNTLGAMFNYAIGRMGRLDWIEKYLHVKPEKLQKVQHIMAGHGAWVAFFAFLPGVGEAISIVLGLMHANIIITSIATTLGKLTRYIVLAYGVNLMM